MVERVLEKRLCRIVTVSKIQFGCMPERGTIDAVFILRRHKKSITLKVDVYVFIGPKDCF